MVPLVHQRGKVIKVLPVNDLALKEGDDILFCMRPAEQAIFEANLVNRYTLEYLLTGQDPARSNFFRWLSTKKLANT